jgi:hypothetical protein
MAKLTFQEIKDRKILRDRQYYEKNKEKINTRSKKYHSDYRESILESRRGKYVPLSIETVRHKEMLKKQRLMMQNMTVWDTLNEVSKEKVKERALQYGKIGSGLDKQSYEPYSDNENELILTGMYKDEKILLRDIALLLKRTVRAISTQRYKLRKKYYRYY